MALPNPQDKLVGQSSIQTETLKDLLVVQKDVEKWSQNTDVNTFRGIAAEKKAGARIQKKLEAIQGGEKSSIDNLTQTITGETQRATKEQGETITSAFSKIGGTIFSPLKRLSENLRQEKFAELDDQFLNAQDNLRKGSDKVVNGFKEITNGIGALGPVINAIRTAMFKAVAVVNILTGGLQFLFGAVQSLFSMGYRQVFKSLGKESEGMLMERLEAEEEQAAEELKQAEAEFEKQKKEESVMGASVPLPVTIEGQTQTGIPGVPAQQSESIPQILDSSGNPITAESEVDEQSDRLKELDEKRKKAQEAFDKSRKLKQEAADKRAIKGDKKRFKLFRGLIARLNMISMAGMMKFLGVVTLLSGLVIAIKNGVGGAPTAMVEIIKNQAKRTFNFFDDVATKLGFTGAGVDKALTPGTGGNPLARVPKGQTVTIDGKVYKGGQMLPKGTQVSQTGEVFKNGVKQSATRTALRTVAKVATPVAGTVEAVMDVRDNDKKFQAIKSAYDAGESFVPDGEGGMRQMTADEFKQLEKAQTANFSGSVGKGIGATLGAIGGGALVGFFTGGPIGAIVGAVAGGIGGAYVGDEAGTGLAEIFTGTENSQEILDKLYSQVPQPEQVGEVLDQVQTDIAETTSSPRESGQVFNNQQVVNNNNQDTISVGQTPFSNTQLEYSYGD